MSGDNRPRTVSRTTPVRHPDPGPGIRLSLDPFRSGAPFRQELRLRQGEAVIEAGGMVLRVRVDAMRPVIRVEAGGKAPFSLEAPVELGRTEMRPLDPGEVSGVDLFGPRPRRFS